MFDDAERDSNGDDSIRRDHLIAGLNEPIRSDMANIKLVLLFVITLFCYTNAFTSSYANVNEFWTPPVYGEQKALGYDAYSFTQPKALEPEVQFWVSIYTKYSSQQGIFHINGQTEKIVGDIDLTAIYTNPKWSAIRKEKEADKIILRERKRLARINKFKDYKLIRFQRGLSDRMKEAIDTSGYYLPMMEKVFRENNLPIELTRLVFVESSFNVEARSRVGASGLWQIMPRIGRKFKYLQKSFDKRDHPYYATKLAAKILKENYNILDNWPLAVTSYNFGVGSMLKVKRKLKTNDVDKIFGGSSSNRFIGFASRNFYATFLAALHVEAHANIYFGEPFSQKKSLALRNIYLDHDLLLEDILSNYKLNKKDFVFLNPHIKQIFLNINKKLPKGTLISVPMNNALASDQRDD